MAGEEPRDEERDDSDIPRMEQAMRDETQEAFSVAPSGAVLTPGQVKGGISGALLGGVAGAAIGALIGLVPLFDMSVGMRILVIAAVAAVAGSVVGALLGGFFRPDKEGETGDLPGEGPRSQGERRSGHAE